MAAGVFLGARPLAAMQVTPSAAFAQLERSGGLETAGPFPFDYQYLAFYPGSGNLTEVLAAVSVQAGRLRPRYEGGWSYAVGVHFQLLRGDTVVADRSTLAEHTLRARLPEEITDGIPAQVAVKVPPGRYRYRLEVVDRNWHALEATHVTTGELEVPRFAGSGLLVSSIAVAADTGGTWNPTPDLALKLNAARIVRPNARPFVYYEVYGLTPGARFRGEVRLQRLRDAGAGGSARVASRVLRGAPFQLQYQGTAPREAGRPAHSALWLDLASIEPGDYVLTVRITDLSSGGSSPVRRTGLTVQPEEAGRTLVPIAEVPRAESERS